ncbi:MAG TPA: alpha/beta hydrolase [Acidobacteriota bacterium]|nr:alpha/beta hydrolase [Acidobacteriota bacterium]
MKQLNICIFSLFLFANSWSFGQRSMEQDPSLNNLVHPEGYAAAEPGTFGHVEKRGQGAQPMILIPGGGFGWEVFESFMQRHEEDFTMYAVTLAGMGGTPAPPMPPEGTSYGERTWISGAVQALKELIEGEQLERPVIVGHFLEGTHVALEMALEQPESVGAVIIMGGSAKFANPQYENVTLEQRIGYYDSQMAPNWFKTVTLKTWNDNNFPASSYSNQPEVAESLYPKVSKGPLQIYIRYLLEFWSGDPSQHFGDIKVPVLVLMPTFSEEYKKEMDAPWLDHYFVDSWKGTAGQPLMKTEQVPDAHLFVWLDNPQVVDQAVKDFLAKRH